MADELLLEISRFTQQGRVKNVTETILDALALGILPGAIIEGALIAAMNEIGAKFSVNKVFVPEVLLAARAMKEGMKVLEPSLRSGDFKVRGKAVLGTVRGDQHDIGKNLVKVMFEGKGIEVIDLGVNVSSECFVEAAVKNGAGIIGASALLTTTMPVMKEIVELLEKEGLKGQIKLMIGGAPVSQQFCDDIGADRYSKNASEASEAALKILGS